MKRRHFVQIIVFAVFTVICWTSVQALAGGVKDRMKQRLPTIIALKAKGIIGENSQGVLEFVGNKKSKEDVVKAENTDRKKVYSSIAKKQGTSRKLVGERRARQIADKAKKGEWLKGSDGKWRKKK